MDPDRLTVGAKDAELDARLDAELTAYNLATSGVHEQAEFTVRIEDDAGDLVAGLSGWRFQAPGFYLRHGYVETGRTEGLPLEGAADVHLAKRLD